MSSLLEMTDVPMTNILEKCGFESVLNLRKVCHSLRNFVDDAFFKTDLGSIQITIGFYGFSVVCQKRNPLLANGYSIAKDWTSNDLKIVLKLVENSKLSSFRVITNPDNVGGLDDLGEILKNQTRPLQTALCFLQMESSEILKVLPYLDSKTLREILIRPPNYETGDQNLDGIEKVMELEQFKNAVVLNINNWFVAFVTSTHMEYFELTGLNLNENQLEQLFGTPSHDRGWQWFFKIQNSKEHVLEIEWVLGGLIFYELEAKEVPQDAVVYH